MPIGSGGVSRVPHPDMSPHHAWSVNSSATTPASGPSLPNAETRTTLVCAPRARSRTPSPRMPPVSSPTTTTSAARRSVSMSSASSASYASSAMTMVFASFRNVNSAPVVVRGASGDAADHQRSGSPPGRSIFVTSAPRSASSFVAYAPAMPSVASTTRNSIIVRAFDVVTRSALDGLERVGEPLRGLDVLLDEAEHHVTHRLDVVHAADDLADRREQQVLAV